MSTRLSSSGSSLMETPLRAVTRAGRRALLLGARLLLCACSCATSCGAAVMAAASRAAARRGGLLGVWLHSRGTVVLRTGRGCLVVPWVSCVCGFEARSWLLREGARGSGWGG